MHLNVVIKSNCDKLETCKTVACFTGCSPEFFKRKKIIKGIANFNNRYVSTNIDNDFMFF